MLFRIPTAHNMSSSKPHIIEVRFTLQRGFSFRFKPCLLRTHADLITMPNLDRLEFPSFFDPERKSSTSVSYKSFVYSFIRYAGRWSFGQHMYA